MKNFPLVKAYHNGGAKSLRLKDIFLGLLRLTLGSVIIMTFVSLGLCFAQTPDNQNSLTLLVYRNINWNKFLSLAPKNHTWKAFLADQADQADPLALKGLIEHTGLNPFDSITGIEEFIFLDETNETKEFLFIAKGKFEPEKFNRNFARVLRNVFKLKDFQENSHNGKQFFTLENYPLKKLTNYIYLHDSSTLVLTTHKNSIIKFIENEFKPIKNNYNEEVIEKNDIFFISGLTKNFPLFKQNFLCGYFDLTRIALENKGGQKGQNDIDGLQEAMRDMMDYSLAVLANFYTHPIFGFMEKASLNPKIASKENYSTLRLSAPAGGNGSLLKVQFDTKGLNKTEKENLMDSANDFKNSPGILNNFQQFIMHLATIDQFKGMAFFLTKKRDISGLTGKKIISIENFIGDDESDVKRMENFINNPTLKIEQGNENFSFTMFRPWKKGFLDKLLDK